MYEYSKIFYKLFSSQKYWMIIDECMSIQKYFINFFLPRNILNIQCYVNRVWWDVKSKTFKNEQLWRVWGRSWGGITMPGMCNMFICDFVHIVTTYTAMLLDWHEWFPCVDRRYICDNFVWLNKKEIAHRRELYSAAHQSDYQEPVKCKWPDTHQRPPTCASPHD